MVRIGEGKRRIWVFRRPGEVWRENHIDPYIKGSRAGVMIWSCFSGTDLGDLVIIRSHAGKRTGTINGMDILNLYQQQLGPFCQEDSVFMQDNAPVHSATIVTDWLQERSITVMKCPPYSPDLNPIEHLWSYLKQRLYIQHPDLLNSRKGKNQLKDDLINALEQTWRTIPETYLASLYKSMKDRCHAVIRARGGYTRY